MNINKCIFAGNLTRDPETRTTSTGKTVSKFSLAVNNPGREDDTFFIDCEAWNKTAEIADKYLQKGSNCCVDGRMATDKWETREGDKRSKPVLIVNQLHLGARPRDAGDASHSAPQRGSNASQGERMSRMPQREARDDDPSQEDDLPF